MRVVDSVGWIEFFSGGPLVSAYSACILQPSEVITPAIVLYEVYKRMLQQLGKEAAIEAAGQIGKTNVIPLDAALSVLAAQYSLSYKLPMADAIIYATAQAEGATVVTSDAHFQGLPGVEFIPRS